MSVFNSADFNKAIRERIQSVEDIKAREELERRHVQQRSDGRDVDKGETIMVGYDSAPERFFDKDFGEMDAEEKTECDTHFRSMISILSDPSKMARKTLFDRKYDFSAPSYKCAKNIAPRLTTHFEKHPFYAGFAAVRKQSRNVDYAGDRESWLDEPKGYTRVTMNKEDY